MRILEHPGRGVRPRLTEVRGSQPAYQAYTLLYFGYIALPVIAGLDKFFDALVNWSQYLSPAAQRLLGGNPDAAMRLVGIVEIAAGLLVAFKPRIGALVVALWLLGIVANLALTPAHLDVALRDVGLAAGAFALWRLSEQFSD